MFRKTSTIPQRNKFCLSKEEIIEDIEAIYRNEEQRSKLYFCIDEKPPREHKFENIEEFLKGSQDLEKNSNILTHLINEMERLKEDIEGQVNNIRKTISDTFTKREIC